LEPGTPSKVSEPQSIRVNFFNEENSKQTHFGLAQQNGFGSTFLHKSK
jgi:hypothetical protein